MKAAQLFVKALENEGVEYIFGIPGEENIDVMDALLDSPIKFVTCHHEQGAAFMADVYGRLTGRAGVCMSTLGPGATNLITGVADANMDRAPVVAIAGQGATTRLHKESHQILDQVSLFKPITKYATQILEPEIVAEVVRKAFKVAQTEKPDAAFIDFPENVAEMEVDKKPIQVQTAYSPEAPAHKIEQAAKLISAAKAPVILAGNGVIRQGAADELVTFAEVLRIPVANTFMAKGVRPFSHELSLGTIGLKARDIPWFAFEKADVVICVGYDMVEYRALVIDDSALATRLVTDRRVGFFSFIGSGRVGWMLRSKLAPGTRCALEHGGVAPALVAPDADLDAAVPKLVKGGFYHAGQVCVSVQRIFAHRSIAEPLARRIPEQARALVVGDPTSPQTEVGPLIRHQEVERVDAWVREAVDGGATLLCGGQPLSASCYAPTVLLEPPAQSKVSTEEVFGPVVCVYAYDELDEAIARANALPVAFQAAVFTRDHATAMRAYARLDASAVMLNDHTAFRVDWMPFAGLRESGLGVGGIPHTFRDMQIEKMFIGAMP